MKTYTGLLTNFLSFTSFKYKIGLVKTLIDRAFKINNTDKGFQWDLKDLTQTLKRNSLPAHVIDKANKQYLSKTNNAVNSNVSSSQNNDTSTEVRYFKLPYIGNFSKITQTKIKKLCKLYCPELNLKLVFTSLKIKQFFSFKDPIPDALKSCVIYQFTHAGCQSRYIGESSRHFSTRIKEHISSDKNSHIFKHLKQSKKCRNKYSLACFKILDTAKSHIYLKLKEAFFIETLKPELNVQVKRMKTVFKP